MGQVMVQLTDMKKNDKQEGHNNRLNNIYRELGSRKDEKLDKSFLHAEFGLEFVDCQYLNS
ncbi:unnamed protein product, partial [Schistosoma haematobium]